MGTRRGSERKIDERIWNAAIKLFASKGFAATGIREIGDEAGLSVSAMYYYVDNKEDLLLKIMRDTQERLVAAGRFVVETLPEPAAGLAGLVELHVAVHARSPLEARVVDTEVRALGDEGRREVIALRDEYESLWNDVLSRGAEAGVFHFRELRTTRLALLEMCNGVAAWYSQKGSLGISDVATEFADLALAMVRAGRGRRPVTVADLGLPDPEVFVAAVDELVPPAVGTSEALASAEA
jgi:AcrR family transcriptional regulator